MSPAAPRATIVRRPWLFERRRVDTNRFASSAVNRAS